MWIFVGGKRIYYDIILFYEFMVCLIYYYLYENIVKFINLCYLFFFFLRINSLYGYEFGLGIFIFFKKVFYYVLVNNFDIVI